MNISFDKAKEILGGFTAQAQDMLKDGSKVEAALQALEAKMKEIPTIGEGLSRLPLMISMIRAYITKEYTEVSPKVVASMLCAVLYLVKGRDLIRDDIPVVGLVDDIAARGSFVLWGPEYKRPKADLGEQLNPWYNRKHISVGWERGYGGEMFTDALPRRLADDYTALMPMFRFLREVYNNVLIERAGR